VIKSQLIAGLAATNPHLFTKDVEKAVNAIFDDTAVLARRDRVELRGFGAFFARTRRARPGRNPKNGVSISVPEMQHPAFRAAKGMRERLNGTASGASSDKLSHDVNFTA
jgi:integration host factor subunit beta